MSGHPFRGNLGGKKPDDEQPDPVEDRPMDEDRDEATQDPSDNPHPFARATRFSAPPSEEMPGDVSEPLLASKGAAKGAYDTLDLTDEQMLPTEQRDVDDHAIAGDGLSATFEDDDSWDPLPPIHSDPLAPEDDRILSQDAPDDGADAAPLETTFEDRTLEDEGDHVAMEREEQVEDWQEEAAPLSPSDDGRTEADDRQAAEATDTFDAPPPIDWGAEPVSDHIEDVPATPAGRRILAVILSIAALGWLGLVGWSAGSTLDAGVPRPDELALWIAIAAAPLILLALLWMMFGRTRRREAEAFTRQVALMRAEAQALDQRLHSMSHNLGANRQRLGELAGELEGRADEATERMRTVADELEHGASRLAQHGVTLDTAANNARADMAALVESLPDAEARVLAMGQQLQGAGSGALEDIRKLEAAIASLGARTSETETRMADARGGLEQQLRALEETGDKAIGKVEHAQRSTGELVDGLLARSASTLEQIRGGIATQAEAIQTLLQQAQGGIERSSTDAAASLANHIRGADGALSRLGEQVRERDEQTRLMLANLDEGLGALEERFDRFGRDGDGRAQNVVAQLSAVREQLAATRAEAQEQDGMIDSLATRTSGMRDTLNALSSFLNQQLAGDIGGAQDGMERLVSTGEVLTPQLTDIRANATGARDALETTATRIEESRSTLAAMLETVDSGAGKAEARLAELQESIAILQSDAKSLSDETGPALLEALSKVQDASGRAREAARDAISKAIPEAARNLSQEARTALAKAVEDVVLTQMRELDQLSSRAVDAARSASDRLSAQMLSIGQTANALEAHLADVGEQSREGQSEAFASQVSLLMESMNSAAIDVEKILSDEVDDKSWAAYLKGERGVFTRKAVRLLSAGEAREIGAVYDEDPEFRNATNRFVHDFEAMLRRVLAERDGAIIGVTLMSSDMGKLYAALAQVVERKR